MPVQAFLKEAKTQGFDDAKRSGKITVGEVLAQIFGIDTANWHEVTRGVSHYVLLERAMNSPDISL